MRLPFKALAVAYFLTALLAVFFASTAHDGYLTVWDAAIAVGCACVGDHYWRRR